MLYLDILSYEALNTVSDYSLTWSSIGNRGCSCLKMNQSGFSKEKTELHSSQLQPFSLTSVFGRSSQISSWISLTGLCSGILFVT
jgi:hypothetical protein